MIDYKLTVVHSFLTVVVFFIADFSGLLAVGGAVRDNGKRIVLVSANIILTFNDTLDISFRSVRWLKQGKKTYLVHSSRLVLA